MCRENAGDRHLLDPHRSAPLQDVLPWTRGETADRQDEWHVSEWDDVFWTVTSAPPAPDLRRVAP